jgi:hypothetical protein
LGSVAIEYLPGAFIFSDSHFHRERRATRRGSFFGSWDDEMLFGVNMNAHIGEFIGVNPHVRFERGGREPGYPRTDARARRGYSRRGDGELSKDVAADQAESRTARKDFYERAVLPPGFAKLLPRSKSCSI